MMWNLVIEMFRGRLRGGGMGESNKLRKDVAGILLLRSQFSNMRANLATFSTSQLEASYTSQIVVIENFRIFFYFSIRISKSFDSISMTRIT